MTVECVSTKWQPEIKAFSKDIPFLLVGTRTDLRDGQEGNRNFVTVKEGEKKAKEIGAVCYMECSSKEMKGVSEVFDKTVHIGLGSNDNANDNATKKEHGKCTIQ